MGNNVMIPLSTLEHVVELLDCTEVSGHSKSICNKHNSVLRELKTKLQKIELRDTYAKVFRSHNHEDRMCALTQYLDQKHRIGASDVGEDPFAKYINSMSQK